MKRGVITLLILILLTSPILLAETSISPEEEPSQTTEGLNLLSNSDIPKPTTNAWNETIIISDTWQQLIGTFFGLNLKNVDTNISVREALVLFAVFIMFLVIIYDILKLMPFFKTELGPVSGEFIAALIVTALVSISGAFINLKDLFLNFVAGTIDWLNWSWLGSDSILTGVVVIIVFLILWAFFDFLNPIIKKHSQLSRAEAKGRLLNTVVEKSDI